MKKHIFCFLFSVIAFAAVTGCQPSPHEDVVVNDDTFWEILASDPDAQPERTFQLSLPAGWQETVPTASEDFVIEVNVDIQKPAMDSFSVAGIKAERFGQDYIDQLIAYFAGDRKLFEWPSTLTKSDIEAQLIEYKRGVEVDGIFEQPPADDPYIAELETRIRNAPETADRNYISSELSLQEDGSQGLTAGIEWTNDEDAFLIIRNHGKDSYDSAFIFNRGGQFLTERELALNDMKLGDILITEEEALQLADNALVELGISHMGLSSIKPAQMLAIENLEGRKSNYASTGYLLTFMRQFDGLLTMDTSMDGVYFIEDRSEGDFLPEYSAPWFQETIGMYIDENGIQRFDWTGYSELNEERYENIELIEFDVIKERAKKNLYYQNAYLRPAYTRMLMVDRAVLGVALINQKNEPGVGLLVPAWYFYYTVENTRKDNPERVSSMQDTLVINAVDGSVIQPFPTQ